MPVWILPETNLPPPPRPNQKTPKHNRSDVLCQMPGEEGPLRGPDVTWVLEQAGKRWGYRTATTRVYGDLSETTVLMVSMAKFGVITVAVGAGHEHSREWDVCV